MPPAHRPESAWHLATLGGTPVTHEAILQLIEQVRGSHSQAVGSNLVTSLCLAWGLPDYRWLLLPLGVETEVDRDSHQGQIPGSSKTCKEVHIAVALGGSG